LLVCIGDDAIKPDLPSIVLNTVNYYLLNGIMPGF